MFFLFRTYGNNSLIRLANKHILPLVNRLFSIKSVLVIIKYMYSFLLARTGAYCCRSAFSLKHTSMNGTNNGTSNHGGNNTSVDDTSQTNSANLKYAKAKYGTVNYVPFVELNEFKMPALALGTALVPNEEVGAVVDAAIDLGYRHIDAAMIYGNEAVIGDAISEKIRRGHVKREELFITSKLWNSFHRRDLVLQACRQTLHQLRVDYLDLYLIHSPTSFKEGGDPVPFKDDAVQFSEDSDFMDAWRGLEDLVEAGLVRNIGVCNFNSEQLQRILDEGSVKPVVDQVECNPYLPQLRLGEFCKSKGITLGCYSSLGSMGTPGDYLTVGNPVLHDPVVKALAEKYGKTPSQILIRYQIDRGHYAVVKTTSAARLNENIGVTRFQLSNGDIETLNRLDRNQRQFTFIGMGDKHKDYPFNIPF